MFITCAEFLQLMAFYIVTEISAETYLQKISCKVRTFRFSESVLLTLNDHESLIYSDGPNLVVRLASCQL